ncbi:sigma-54 dependent transcriptional regulator [bacterium]|nr:sigma-54 dependent transcriptional regulator [bacterium]
MIERRILVVDDEPGARLVLERSLARANCTVECAENGEQALEKFRNQSFPVVVTDINMPGMSGLDLLREIREQQPETAVLMITAYADLDSAIQAIRSGAYDYIVKPIKPDLMVKAVDRAFEKLELRDEVTYLQSQIREHYGFDAIVGQSPAIKETVRLAARVAGTDESVLITGPSGTGKELFARAIHLSSPRDKHRFIAVNCGGFPDHLLESELFGYKRGAFTGAATDKPGLIAEADNGTIFFDEIAELPIGMQVKLLRFLQDHHIRPVGAVKEQLVNVRVVAATNRDLEAEVAEGKFREDLYYRLRVLAVEVPALKDRPEDIPVLLQYFAERTARRMGKAPPEFSEAAAKRLAEYEWPGNVRELENLVKNVLIMNDARVIQPGHLPAYVTQPDSGGKKNGFISEGNLLASGASYSDLRNKVLEDFNQAILSEALELENWNISKAAERLGTAKSNVIRLMKRFHLQKP